MDHDQPHGTRNTAAESPASSPSQEAVELDDTAPNSLAIISTISSTGDQNHGPVRRKALQYWRRHISMAVPHVDCRDHLGERQPEPDSFALYARKTTNDDPD